MKDLISNSKLDSDEVLTCYRREYLHILWVHSKTSRSEKPEECLCVLPMYWAGF